VGIDGMRGKSDEPDDADQGCDQAGQSERRTPADRLGEPGYPSCADARQAATESNQKPVNTAAETSSESSAAKGSPKTVKETPRQGEQDDETRESTSQEHIRDPEGTSAVSETKRGPVVEQKLVDIYVHPLKRMPSYGSFANLHEEFAARSASRELGQRDHAANEKVLKSETGPGRDATTLNEGSIKEQIDPFAPDAGEAEGHKDAFEPTARGKDAEWTEGIDSFNDLPTGEELAAPDDERMSKSDKFRQITYEEFGGLKDGAKEATGTIEKIFGPRPTGHPETRVDGGPTVVDANHFVIDAGSAASTVLAAGIVGAEVIRWGRGKIKEWGDGA
jgi:hypothetical protein